MKTRTVNGITVCDINPSLDDSDFEMTFPPGMKVEDERTGKAVSYLVTPGGQMRRILPQERGMSYEELLRSEPRQTVPRTRPKQKQEMSPTGLGLIRWVEAHSDPEDTNMNNAGTVHVERVNRCTAYRCLADDVTEVVAPLKMAIPMLSSWIEQPHTSARLPIAAEYLTTFRIVADRTGVAQILGHSLAAQRFGNDVVDLEGFGAQFLLQLAVLADGVGAFLDKFPESL